jgi:hypothetical protein
MLEALKRMVLPRIPIKHCIENWPQIRHQLADPPRKRVKQIDRIGVILS